MHQAKVTIGHTVWLANSVYQLSENSRCASKLLQLSRQSK